MEFYNREYLENYDFEDRKPNRPLQHNDCCIKKVETYYCCPSYYNEEEKDDYKKEEKQYPCYEGTIKLYPTFYNNKKENDHNECNKKENNSKCSRKCCFGCNFFRRW